MVTCYPKEFCDTHDIIDKTFFTGHEYDAKKDRDTLARKLRKDGYTVETKKYRFDTRDSYTIHATRLKPIWYRCPDCKISQSFGTAIFEGFLPKCPDCKKDMIQEIDQSLNSAETKEGW